MPHRSAVAVRVRSFYRTMESNVELANMKVARAMGDHCWHITNMAEDDLRSLLTMIKGAGLLERRTFDGVKRQIEDILKV